MKSLRETRKQWKNEEEQYSFANYKPNKNAVPCVVNGTKYLSKKQACVLEGITRKELEDYLKNNN